MKVDSGGVQIRKINFKIPQEWVLSNNFSENKISLFAYKEGSWHELSTVFLTSGEELFYETKINNGISYFAIAPSTGKNIFDKTLSWIFDNKIFIIVLFVLILSLVVIFLTFRKLNKKKKQVQL